MFYLGEVEKRKRNILKEVKDWSFYIKKSIMQLHFKIKLGVGGK